MNGGGVRRRGTTGAIVCAGFLFLAVSSALADTATVTLGKTPVDFKPADGGGGTASITLTNLTDDPKDIIVTAAPASADADCKVDLDQGGRLPKQQSVTFKATATEKCGKVENEFGIVLTAGGKSLPKVTAKVEDTKKPDWNALWLGFVGALVVAAFLMTVTWKRAKGDVTAGLSKGKVENPSWRSPLPYLKDTWSFKDSWASNVTLVAGLLAGVFGSSSVLKGVLGDKTEESLTLATIGGAVSAGLIGLAGVVAIGCKTMEDGKFTPRGVLIGSAVALGAAGGQIVVVYLSAKELDVGLSDHLLFAFAVVSLVILGWYGYASVKGVLVQGATPIPTPEHDPVAEPVSETVFSAALIAASANPELSRTEVDALLKRLQRPSDQKDEIKAVKTPSLRELAAAPSMLSSGRALLP
jgi:hypothetical protein